MPNIGIALASGSIIGGAVIMLALWAYDKYQRHQQNERRHAYHERPPRLAHSGSAPPQPSNDCSICQDSLSSPLEILPCGHLFHRLCIKNWFRHRMTCPVCRLRISDQLVSQYNKRLGL